MSRFLFLFVVVTILGCEPSSQGTNSEATPSTEVSEVADIIAKSIDHHGAARMDVAFITFDFRDKHYEGAWNHGEYRFERRFKEEAGPVRDVLNSRGLRRLIASEEVPVSDSLASLYSASINSVWYFVMLPFRLQDPAVEAKLLGTATIKGQPYYKVQVTFAAEGGGEDFEDVYVYWFSKKDFKLDYLAYSFEEESGLGLRFREAINPQRVEGVLFQDYQNYEADPAMYQVEQLDKAFDKGDLKLLSTIELKNITVQ